MTQKERMLAGLPYKAWMDGLPEERARAQRACWEFNRLPPDARAERTALLRGHTMRGAFAALEAQGLPGVVVQQIADSVDCKLFFFDHAVGQGAMYLVLGGSIVVLLGIYILLTRLRKQRG